MLEDNLVSSFTKLARAIVTRFLCPLFCDSLRNITKEPPACQTRSAHKSQKSVLLSEKVTSRKNLRRITSKDTPQSSGDGL